MAWMIREDQLDPEQREFINRVIVHNKNFVFVDNTFQNFQLMVILFYIIKRCKEVNILLLFPNNLLLTQYKKIYSDVIDEIFIERKTVHFNLIDNFQNSDLTIYFLVDCYTKVACKDNRSIYFTHYDLEIPNSEKFKYSFLHQHRPSLRRIAEKIKGYNIHTIKGDVIKVDTSITSKAFENEKEEFEFIVNINEKARYYSELGLVLFSNNLFLMRFINHLFDYAHFDLAENEFEVDEYNKINDLLDNYGLPYVIVSESTDYQNINQPDLKTFILTFSTAKFLIGDNKSIIYLPQTNRISFGLNRSNELADFLVSATPKMMYTTSSQNVLHPNSIKKLFNL